MRKIFSAALALVCVWFATPALANCNLLNPDTITSTTVTIPVEYGKTYVWSYDKTNYDFRWDSGAVYGVDSNNELVDGGVALSPNGSASYNATSYFVIQIINPSVVAVQTIFRAASIQPTIESIKNSKMMFEEGTTATAYTPYNPLCATCNGTIVNYTSATGTGVQNGTPTPTNPIEPTFYKQGNMILRKVGDVADSYDATTGKITRRVGVKVFDGTENWGMQSINDHGIINFQLTRPSDWAYPLEEILTSHFRQTTEGIAQTTEPGITVGANLYVRMFANVYDTVEKYKQYLAAQYAAGTPVTVWYPLETETTEDWTETSYCETPIKIATTKYNETAFGPLNTALQNAISVVDTVVSNTITQAASIATLQAQKQTRPNDIADDNEKCPAGIKCLLVEDANGTPHWYEIVENAWDLPAGYTQLQYIESTGGQYIDTGIIATNWDWSVEFEMSVPQAGDMFFGAGRGLWGSADWGAQFGLANSSGNANWGAGSGGMNVVISNLGVRTNTFYNYKITKEGLYINGELKSQNTATESFSNSNLSLWICKTNNPGTSGYNRSASSWKYVRIYNADTALVFNGVPAKNSSGVVGMYDKVSGEFFENKGTGSFIAGPVAE